MLIIIKFPSVRTSLKAQLHWVKQSCYYFAVETFIVILNETTGSSAFVGYSLNKFFVTFVTQSKSEDSIKFTHLPSHTINFCRIWYTAISQNKDTLFRCSALRPLLDHTQRLKEIGTSMVSGKQIYLLKYILHWLFIIFNGFASNIF